MTGPDDAGAAATAGERALLDPAVRMAGADVLVHPRFVEFGSSGRRWGRAEILEATAGELSLAGEQVETSDWCGQQLADDVVQLTHRTEVGGRSARCSSVWRHTPAGWQIWFHQGTPEHP
ncbi:hypothetical protein SAMN03159343_2939 [Klenkia marina]|uniref:DUF4440 domain-containing protein n=1 Tax=Klenkia marina TaxID=1960309 RepID=A0A1G4YI87_9ACTN|nr:nuclear transport factor 2 family protein [Klenkia marina]SCX53217.1 hypothetical protein SAMN03159343_2939 [Klenkia marina]